MSVGGWVGESGGSWACLPQQDISIFILRELLSRLLALAHSDVHAMLAEDELFPKEPGIRQSWNVTPLTAPTPPHYTYTTPRRSLSLSPSLLQHFSGGSLSDHYLHNYMLSSEEKTNPQILRVN